MSGGEEGGEGWSQCEGEGRGELRDGDRVSGKQVNHVLARIVTNAGQDMFGLDT